MKDKRTKLLFGAGMLILLGAILYLARQPLLRAYTIAQIEQARREGVFVTPEDGMIALIQRHYDEIDRVDIDRAGVNSFVGQQPHVWFVSARVFASRRADGKVIPPGEYDYPGSYFLHIEDGWVHLPEGAFPELVGRVMEEFELFGCDHQTGNCR